MDSRYYNAIEGNPVIAAVRIRRDWKSAVGWRISKWFLSCSAISVLLERLSAV